MNIVLCGMPGAGKTSVGQALALMTGRKFTDTDVEIASRFGSIAGIFSRYGEEFFRAEEKTLCRALQDEDSLIIATGGGTVSDGENLSYLRKRGKIVFLRAKCATLLARLGSARGRPLLQGDVEKNLSALYEKRTPVYLKAADLVVDTDALTVREAAKIILEAIG